MTSVDRSVAGGGDGGDVAMLTCLHLGARAGHTLNYFAFIFSMTFIHCHFNIISAKRWLRRNTREQKWNVVVSIFIYIFFLISS